jgi:hypothetical protein
MAGCMRMKCCADLAPALPGGREGLMVSGVPGGGAPATLPLPLDDPPPPPLAAPLASTVAQ